MCRVEERVYISAEGHRSKFEDTFPCSQARSGRLCPNVKKRTTEYYPKKAIAPRNDTPSPINPPTPTGTGSYLVQQRRPSSSGGRPPTRNGPKSIIIEFGSNKSKKYAGNAHKRSSLNASSADDIAIESPGSDTVRTGYPEAPLPPQTAVFRHTDAYITTPSTSRGYHHRHTSSSSSYTGSSRTPSLYVTSDDYESPAGTRSAKLPPAIHHSPATGAPPSPSKSRIRGGTSSANYNLTVVSPHGGNTHESHAQDGYSSHDYQDFADRSASSHASSGTSAKSRKGKITEQPRRGKDGERKRQEEMARETADALAREENIKQVRFELDRPKARAMERAETLLAEKDKQRAVEREETRQRKEREREPETVKTTQKKEKSQPPTSNTSTRRLSTSRRGSVTMTPAQQEEQRRILAAELGHMQGESRAAEAREREERKSLLMQQQQDLPYYNPRSGGLPNSGPAVARRGSVSSDARPTTLGRSNSRRTSIVQPNPPPINTQSLQSYPQPSARSHGPPPVSFPANFNPRPTSARRSSFSSQEIPFAGPRLSGSNLDNPFSTVPSVISPQVTVHQDPWDARNLHEALPPRDKSDGRYTIQRRGEEVIKASGTHSAARKATRAMGRIAGYEDDYATDSDDQVTHGRARRRYP